MKKRNVYLLGLTSLLNDASSEGVYSVLPVLLKDPFLVGVVGGIFNGFSYVVKPFSGYLSDRIGRAKPFIVLGYFTSALTRTLVALALKTFIPVLVLLDRIGKGVRDAPRDVLLASVENKGWAFGLHRAMDTLGAVLGTIAALLLLTKLDPRGAVLILGILGFISLLPLILVEDHKRKATKNGFVKSVKTAGAELGLLSIVTVLLGLSLISPAVFIERAVSLTGTSGIALYVIFNVVYAFSAYFIGRKSDELGRKTVMFLGSVALILSLLLIPLESMAASITAFALFGVAFGTLLPTLFAMAGDRATEEKGTSLGVVQFLLGLSIVLSSVLAGYLVSKMGYWTLGLFSIPATLATLLITKL